jgi:hypothetical protein
VIALSECFIHWNIRISCNIQPLQKKSWSCPLSILILLLGVFQIVCLQELLLPNFLISTTEPSSLSTFLLLFNLPCRLLMNYCLSFFNVVSLCLSIQVCISSSFLCFEHNHSAQTFIMP